MTNLLHGNDCVTGLTKISHVLGQPADKDDHSTTDDISGQKILDNCCLNPNCSTIKSPILWKHFIIDLILFYFIIETLLLIVFVHYLASGVNYRIRQLINCTPTYSR